MQKKIKAEAEAAKADVKLHQELEDLRNDKQLLKDNLQVDPCVSFVCLVEAPNNGCIACRMQMTKNLVDAKIAERVELEYQLAAKKADFAQAESERIMYEVNKT